MPQASTVPLSSRIAWDFTLTHEGFSARYGRLGLEFWRQHLPLGQVIEELHPPKKIEPRLYEHAKRLASAS